MSNKISSDRDKTCSQCNTTFACSVLNCWCAELPNIMEMSAGGDCFCPSCLKKMIDKKTEII